MTNALDIRGLRFAYASPDGELGIGGAVDPKWVVDVRELVVAAGEQVLLTGRSGRGKSTLMHLIAGLMEPSAGSVRVAGTLVHELRGAARDAFRGAKIGMIFQTFNLLQGFSALENVMAAMMFSPIPRGEHAARAESLLRLLGITEVTQTPDEQSVGMQQRVAVARALACDPVLVLADEPTASLDSENAAAAMELIQSACQQKNAALLCVSHDAGMRERFGAPRGRVLDLDDLKSEAARPGM